MNDYHFMYSGLERDSGLLQQGRANDNRRKVLAALDELVTHGVLMDYSVDLHRDSRRITDVKYTVRPAPNFVGEQKAANKRGRDIHTHALNQGITIRSC